MAARRNLRISGRTSCVPLRRDRWSSSSGQAEREELNLQLSGEVYQVWRGISRHFIANFYPSGRFPTLQVIYRYQHIVAALAETITLMANIDEVIEEHGGWPIE